MSWKAVEMQVALPRTHDVGQLQEQMQQRGQLAQDNIAQNHLKQEEIKRKSVNEAEEKDDVNLSPDQEGQTKDHRDRQQKQKKKDEQTNFKHPYLGKFVDYSG